MHTVGASSRMTEDPGACALCCDKEGLSRQTSLGSLSQQRILCCDRVGLPCVATEVFSVVTRCLAVEAFGVAT